MCCEARSRDVNSSEKTTKTTLASSSSLAPASGEVHDDADDDFCGSFSTTTITIRHRGRDGFGLTETWFGNNMD